MFKSEILDFHHNLDVANSFTKIDISIETKINTSGSEVHCLWYGDVLIGYENENDRNHDLKLLRDLNISEDLDYSFT